MSFTGHCHCGAVTLTIPRAPDYINECSCSLCRTLGARWGYFPPAEVTLTGDPIAYVRTDIDEAVLGTHHCGVCGTITHWAAREGYDFGRMGINMRLFPLDVAAGVEVRQVGGPPGK